MGVQYTIPDRRHRQGSEAEYEYEGDVRFAKVIGTIDANGDVDAQGTGDAARFSNVPFHLSAGIDCAGGVLSGELQVGQDTPPTGLANDPMCCGSTGVRITF